MSFLTIKVLYCDSCDVTFGDTPDVTVAEWRRVAGREGWINNGTLDWCSRKCATLVTPSEEGNDE